MIDFSYFSNKGSYEINEDSIGFAEQPGRQIFILADGLGGHGQGEIASGAAVEYARQYLSGCKVINGGVLKECFVNTHSYLKDIQKKSDTRKGIKTTMVVLVIENNTAFWAHTGDSRLYSFNRFSLESQTKDHSVPQMMVVMGEIKESEIRGNPDRNRLLSALGMDGGTPKVDMNGAGVPVKSGMGFLLCSDGFWEYIEEKRMQHYYRLSLDAGTWLNNMFLEVQQNGAGKKMDNFSAVAIRIR